MKVNNETQKFLSRYNFSSTLVAELHNPNIQQLPLKDIQNDTDRLKIQSFFRGNSLTEEDLNLIGFCLSETNNEYLKLLSFPNTVNDILKKYGILVRLSNNTNIELVARVKDNGVYLQEILIPIGYYKTTGFTPSKLDSILKTVEYLEPTLIKQNITNINGYNLILDLSEEPLSLKGIKIGKIHISKDRKFIIFSNKNNFVWKIIYNENGKSSKNKNIEYIAGKTTGDIILLTIQNGTKKFLYK